MSYLEKFFKPTPQLQPQWYPEQLVEKTTILGVFWRSWVVEQLRANPNYKQTTFKSDDPDKDTFMRLISNYREAKNSEAIDKGAKLKAFKEKRSSFLSLSRRVL